jgi:hypothetical protein
MAPFDDTNKSATVRGESNFHQNVVGCGQQFTRDLSN